MPTKFPTCHDYVIRDGKLVGDFNGLYRDCADPWEQTTREQFASDRAVALNLLARVRARRVLELGCGLGDFTDRIRQAGFEVQGADVSAAAIARARARHRETEFICRAISADDFAPIRAWRPDAIVMSEVTWYVLDCLDRFTAFLRAELPSTWLWHSLTVYPPGVQLYGREKFTTRAGIEDYFGMHYLERGQIERAAANGNARAFFFGRYSPELP